MESFLPENWGTSPSQVLYVHVFWCCMQRAAPDKIWNGSETQLSISTFVWRNFRRFQARYAPVKSPGWGQRNLPIASSLHQPNEPPPKSFEIQLKPQDGQKGSNLCKSWACQWLYLLKPRPPLCRHQQPPGETFCIFAGRSSSENFTASSDPLVVFPDAASHVWRSFDGEVSNVCSVSFSLAVQIRTLPRSEHSQKLVCQSRSREPRPSWPHVHRRAFSVAVFARSSKLTTLYNEVLLPNCLLWQETPQCSSRCA